MFVLHLPNLLRMCLAAVPNWQTGTLLNLKQHSDYCACTILKDANYCMEGHFSRKHVAFQTSGQTKMGWTFVYKEFTLSHFAKK